MTKKATKKTAKSEGKAAEPFKLERVVERVRHLFGQSEIAEFGRGVAEKVRGLKVVESERKSVAAQYAAQEKTIGIEIDELSRKIGDGYEMRQKACYFLKDFKSEQVYYYLCESLEGLDFKNFETADDLLAWLLKDEVFDDPIKTRMLRADERQLGLFEDEADKAKVAVGPGDHAGADSETGDENKKVVTD